mgnify:FL=1
MIHEQRDALFGAIGYTPTAAQLDILNDEARFKLVAGGVRAGKSNLGAMYMFEKIMAKIVEDPDAASGSVYWLVAADYERTRGEFDYLGDAFNRLGIIKRATRQVDPGYIEVSVGSKNLKPLIIKTKSATDYRKLAMEAPMGIVACEASQLDQESYWRLMERVAEKRGWVFLEGTFEGSLGWYPQQFTSWQSPGIQNLESAKSFSLPTWTNTHIFPLGEDDPEIEKMKVEHSDEWFNERVAGIPSPPSGLVHPSFNVNVHVREVEYDPDEIVYLALDPGYSRMTESAYAVEVCHIIDGQVQVFDEIYERELVVSDIIEVAKRRFWWNNTDKFGVIDVAGNAHAGAMPSNTEIWFKEANIIMQSQPVKIIDGIERMNSMLKPDPLDMEPGLIIDPKCKGLISELGGGPNPFDGQVRVYSWQMNREGGVVGNVPRDKYNHAVKALTYLMVNQFGYAGNENYQREVIPVTRFR